MTQVGRLCDQASAATCVRSPSLPRSYEILRLWGDPKVENDLVAGVEGTGGADVRGLPFVAGLKLVIAMSIEIGKLIVSVIRRI